MQGLDGCRRRRLDGVGDTHETCRPTIHGDEHDRLTVAPERLGAISQNTGVDHQRFEVPQIPDGDTAPVHSPNDAHAGHGREITNFR